MLWHFAFSTIASAALAAGAALSPSHVVLEERHTAPKRWIKGDRVHPESVLPVRIGLTQTNLDKGEEYLLDVSHPNSPNYGKHWTSEQVIQAFQPSDETVETVVEWLTKAGIPTSAITHSDNKQWLAFDAPAWKMEELLHAEYHEYEDSISGGVLPSCDRYHVPQHIHPHVDFITPGLKLLAPNPSTRDVLRKRNAMSGGRHGPRFRPIHKPAGNLVPDAQSLTNCDKVVTPACVAALYKIPAATTTTPNATNRLGIYESAGEQWDHEDLNLFFKNYQSRIPAGTQPISTRIDGGLAYTSNVANAGGEAMLDLQIAYPIIYPQNIVVWDENDPHYQNAFQEVPVAFNQLLDAIDGSYCNYTAFNETGDLKGVDPTYPDPEKTGGYTGKLQCGVYKPTNVFSVSYGGQEVDVPISYQKRQCNEFMKLGLQGISFIFASGDRGVGGPPSYDGGYDGGSGCLGPNTDVFNPVWPSTCPYLTSVGATMVAPGANVSGDAQPEVVAFVPSEEVYENYTSGGGFSNIFPIPSYQKSAVAHYFANNKLPFDSYNKLSPNEPNPKVVNIDGLIGTDPLARYNGIGRGYPDVSANGLNYTTYINGIFSLTGGTSEAAPIFASIINRINEERLAAGKTSVGFLNPTLYANPSALNDVTKGSNRGCLTEGFPAAVGWDPATGLGTPNYPALLKVFMSLP